MFRAHCVTRWRPESGRAAPACGYPHGLQVLAPQRARGVGTSNVTDLDLVVEGEGAKVGDETELRSVASVYETKYGAHFTAPEGIWFGLGDSIRSGQVLLYRVTPATVFGFGKGRPFSQTRWGFS